MNTKNGILFGIASLLTNIHKYIGNRKLVAYVNGGRHVVDPLVMWYHFIGQNSFLIIQNKTQTKCISHNVTNVSLIKH